MGQHHLLGGEPDQHLNILFNRDSVRNKMVKFYNKFKGSNFNDSPLSQFNKKLLRNKSRRNFKLTSVFAAQFQLATVFNVVHLYRGCRVQAGQLSERSRASSFARNDKGNLSNSREKQNWNQLTHEKSRLSNKSLQSRATSGIPEIKTLSTNIRSLLKKVEREVKKNSNFHLQVLKKFGVNKKNKFSLEKHLFGVLDQVLLSVFLKLSTFSLDEKFGKLGNSDQARPCS